MTYYATNPSRPNDPAYKWYFTIVDPTDVGGMRKVKNISIQLAYDAKYTDADGVVQYVRDQKNILGNCLCSKGLITRNITSNRRIILSTTTIRNGIRCI